MFNAYYGAGSKSVEFDGVRQSGPIHNHHLLPYSASERH